MSATMRDASIVASKLASAGIQPHQVYGWMFHYGYDLDDVASEPVGKVIDAILGMKRLDE